MMGAPIRQAANALSACLRTLTPADSFRLLLFNQETQWYQKDASAFNQQALDQVDNFLRKVEGAGGTKIVNALIEALSTPLDPNRTRLVILFTDGAVSAEERAYQQVNQLLGKARLFTFGIGPSVNRAFLEELARAGRGVAEFIGLEADIEAAIIRFQDRLSFPALTDLKITDGNSQVWDVYPSPLPDLYCGQPLEIVGRMVASAQSQRLVIEGRWGDKKVTLETVLPPASHSESAIARLWARARLDDLLAREAAGVKGFARDLIINLALRHRLVTPYTAFFARDEEVVGAEGVRPRLIVVSQPLPPGLRLEGFFGVEQTERYTMPVRRAQARPVKRYQAYSIDPESEFVSRDHLYRREIAYLEISPAERTLRWLARTQRANGAWDDDVETTAAALLAFVRHGHTTQSGDFRRQVERAVAWLLNHPGSGFATFLRALALHELAAASGNPLHKEAARDSVQSLPETKDPLADAVRQRLQGKTPEKTIPLVIETLEHLRWAALFPRKGFIGLEEFMAESAASLECALAVAAA